MAAMRAASSPPSADGAEGAALGPTSRPSKRFVIGPRYACVTGVGALGWGSEAPPVVGACMSATYSCAVPRPGRDGGRRRTTTCDERGML